MFDPLAISLVIAANFAFAQIRPKKEPLIEDYDGLEDEIKEWEEVSLTDLQDWKDETIEWDEYGNPSPIFEDEEPNEKLKQAAENFKTQTGVPVMVDPKTGKFYYEEPDSANLDLDSDGVIEEEELEEVFDQVDTNDDGIVDKDEAKVSNLSEEQINKLNAINKSIETLKQQSGITIPDRVLRAELDKLQDLINKKDDDNTITYF